MATSAHAEQASRCRCRPPLGWRLWHSLWMLPGIVGLGVFTWVSTGYVASRTRRMGQLALTILFVIGAAVGLAWVPAEPSTQNASGGYLVLLWGAGLVTVFALNPGYHRWLWRHEQRCTCGALGGRWEDDDSECHTFTTHVSRPGPIRSKPEAEAQPDLLVLQDARSRPPETPEPVVPRSPEPDAIPAPRAGLGDAVVRSAVYAQQKAAMRIAFDDALLSSVVDRMAAAPATRLGPDDMAAALALPPSRLDGGISSLARQLNVDGYGVVRRDGALTVLDVDLLRQQYRV